MQTTKMNTQSKKRGKNANRKTAVPDIAGQEARDAARAEIPEEAPIESQKTADEECPFIDQPAVHPETDVRLLDLNKIVNSTYNPRKNFREETLLELAESIKQSGVLQPICVRPRDEGFEIVYGERRYWAAAMAGLQFIPALIRSCRTPGRGCRHPRKAIATRRRASARGSRCLQAGLAVGTAYDREPRGQVRQVGGLHPVRV